MKKKFLKLFKSIYLEWKFAIAHKYDTELFTHDVITYENLYIKLFKATADDVAIIESRWDKECRKYYDK